MVAWGRTWKAFIAAEIQRLSFEWNEEAQSYKCFVCEHLCSTLESTSKYSDLYMHVLFGCFRIRHLMLFYSDKCPYTWEEDMPSFILTVPVGSCICKCLKYVCACFHAWRKIQHRVRWAILHSLWPLHACGELTGASSSHPLRKTGTAMFARVQECGQGTAPA